MTEIELKFQVPPGRRAAVAAAVAGVAGRRAIAAPAGRLLRHRRRPPGRVPAWRCACAARAGAGCRRSRAGGDGLMTRLEHELAAAANERRAAALDLSLHAGTPAGDRLARCWPSGPGLLDCALPHRHPPHRAGAAQRHGAVLELAFDEGRIVAGEAAAGGVRARDRAAEGAAARAACAGRQLGARHGLWLDIRSKAERGHCWPRGTPRATRRASRSLVGRGDAWPRAAPPRAQAALGQVCRNASQLAEAASASPSTCTSCASACVACAPRCACWRRPAERRCRVARHAGAALFGDLGAARDRDAIGAPVAARCCAARVGWPSAAAGDRPCAGTAARRPVPLRCVAARPAAACCSALIGRHAGRRHTADARRRQSPSTLARKRADRWHRQVMADAAALRRAGR